MQTLLIDAPGKFSYGEKPAPSPTEFAVGQTVTVMPYTTCGKCSSCRQKHFNACHHNQTLGVQQDGTFTSFITTP